MNIGARDEHPAKLAAMLAARRELNKDAVTYLAVVLGGFITLLSLARLLSVIGRNSLLNLHSSIFARPLICLGK